MRAFIRKGEHGLRSVTRRLLLPAAITLVLASLSAGLGVWQLHRLAWKQGILDQIGQGQSRAPVPLSGSAQPFSKVIASGQFGAGVARYGAEVGRAGGQAEMGSHVLSPFQLDQGGVVIVDRGWAPDGFKGAEPAGPQRIVGFIHPSERVTMPGISDESASGRFFSLDIGKIGHYFGLASVEPFALVELGPADALPRPATELPQPPNNHLAYAMTWFGMSIVSLVVFAMYAGEALRPAKPETPGTA